jgi:hypothetical protein
MQSKAFAGVLHRSSGNQKYSPDCGSQSAQRNSHILGRCAFRPSVFAMAIVGSLFIAISAIGVSRAHEGQITNAGNRAFMG